MGFASMFVDMKVSVECVYNSSRDSLLYMLQTIKSNYTLSVPRTETAPDMNNTTPSNVSKVH